jgi:hypothetical protein
LLTIFLRQAGDNPTSSDLVVRHAVTRFTGDVQIGDFVMVITSVSEPGRETHGHAATLEEAKAKLRDSKRAG